MKPILPGAVQGKADLENTSRRRSTVRVIRDSDDDQDASLIFVPVAAAAPPPPPSRNSQPFLEAVPEENSDEDEGEDLLTPSERPLLDRATRDQNASEAPGLIFYLMKGSYGRYVKFFGYRVSLFQMELWRRFLPRVVWIFECCNQTGEDSLHTQKSSSCY